MDPTLVMGVFSGGIDVLDSKEGVWVMECDRSMSELERESVPAVKAFPWAEGVVSCSTTADGVLFF